MARLRGGIIMLSMLYLMGCAYPPLDSETELPSDYTYIIGPGDSI